MVEHNKVDVKLSDSQLSKLKSATRNHSGITLRMNIKMFKGSNLPHELLLTTRQKRKLRNASKNNMSTDIKLSKTQIAKIIQSGGFLGSLLSKMTDPLIKVAVPLAKNILALLGITAAASPIVGGIQKNTWFWSQALEDSNILWKGITKTIENETKEQKGGFLRMLLGTLGASLLRNMLTEKGILRAGYGNKENF